jgi:hypothetical protein
MSRFELGKDCVFPHQHHHGIVISLSCWHVLVPSILSFIFAVGVFVIPPFFNKKCVFVDVAHMQLDASSVWYSNPCEGVIVVITTASSITVVVILFLLFDCMPHQPIDPFCGTHLIQISAFSCICSFQIALTQASLCAFEEKEIDEVVLMVTVSSSSLQQFS